MESWREASTWRSVYFRAAVLMSTTTRTASGERSRTSSLPTREGSRTSPVSWLTRGTSKGYSTFPEREAVPGVAAGQAMGPLEKIRLVSHGGSPPSCAVVCLEARGGQIQAGAELWEL